MGSCPSNLSVAFPAAIPSGSNFLFCDGTVRFLKNSVSQRVYQLLGHRADGEPISDAAF